MANQSQIYVETPWERGTKVCINGLGHMTKMAATPIYGNRRTNGPVNAHLISGLLQNLDKMAEKTLTLITNNLSVYNINLIPVHRLQLMSKESIIVTFFHIKFKKPKVQNLTLP